MKIQLRILLSIASLAGCMSFITTDKKTPAVSYVNVLDTAGTNQGNTFSSAAFSLNKETPAPFPDLSHALALNKASQLLLGRTKQGREIGAYFFPGTSDKRALVIGGMHGSELSSIEVSNELIRLLATGEQPYYSIVVIPSLFPDNAYLARNNPSLIGGPLNIGRYSYDNGVDPNRQMPSPGTPFNEEDARDHIGRIIEKENQLLLQLINFFRPTRIANLHAIRHTNYGGVYADPRTDHTGIALGFSSDSSLAISIATYISKHGGNVAGNQLSKKPTVLYYKDPLPVEPGFLQKRNMTGSALNARRGSGVSLGTWGTTAIYQETDSAKNRPAMRVITIEFPGARRPEDHKTGQQQRYWQHQVELFAKAIETVFLGDHAAEE